MFHREIFRQTGCGLLTSALALTGIARLTAVQPPFPDKVLRNADMLRIAHRLVEQAGEDGSDLVLLPELINTYEIEGYGGDVMQTFTGLPPRSFCTVPNSRQSPQIRR